MGQTADQLRQEIDAKRDDAASKIDQIESRVTDTAGMAMDTVEQAKTTVTDTVDQVKGTVTDTVDQVKQSVQNVDFGKQIEERPLVALGAALAGGFLLGGLLGGGGGGGGQQDGGGGGGGGQQDGGGNYQSAGQQGGRASGLRGAAQSSGLDDTVSAIGGTLMGMLTERVRSTVEQNFPEFNDRMRQHTEQQAARGGQGQGNWLDPSSASAQPGPGAQSMPDRADPGVGRGAAGMGSSGLISTPSAAGTDATGRPVPS